MVHVMVVSEKSGASYRGEILEASTPQEAGIFIYYAVHDLESPRCGLGPLPDVTLAESVASSLVHELGHALQLGHETATGGGLNPWNVMILPSSCAEEQNRYHGWNNTDPALGATEAVAASRFSDAAASLMRFDQKVSADTGSLSASDM